MTANSKEAASVSAAGALDYHAKPLSEAALSTSILLQRTPRLAPEPDGSRPLFLIGEREHRLYPLDPQGIDYIRSDGNYVRYVVGSVGYIARETGKHLEQLLSPVGFLRIERSLLVNMRAIAYVEPIGRGTFEFTLTSGARLRSGATYREAILAVFSLTTRRAGSRS
jgi:DNA-binding LytR/AlgR family response regulator